MGIGEITLHLEQVPPGMAIEEVVDVFNRLNSGGTKLSQGDLALARICAAWPQARTRLVALRDEWRASGFDFTLDWLLRVVNAIVTGEARFSALKDVDPATFREGLDTAAEAIDALLNLVGSRLGLDHDRVLGGRYGFPVMARYWSSVPRGTMTDEDRGKLLYWYLQAALWGRHSGSTESVLDQDLEALERGGLDGLIEQLRIWRGDLAIRPENLIGANVGSRLYPLVYLLSRVHGARDLGTANLLTSHLLGRLSRLELHHVFPKARLQAHGYAQPDRNALANFCFLTQDTNLAIGMRPPADYLTEFEARNPGVLASQWIPDDPELWHLDRYPDFLDARRRLLAAAANAFLGSLVRGAAVPSAAEVATAAQPVVVGEPDAMSLHALADEAVRLGLAAPEFDHEVVNEESREVQAWANLAWPNGVQAGLTQPVAYLTERSDELQGRFGELGWRCYTDEAALRRYFEEILGIDLDGDGVVGVVPEVGEPLSGDARCWLVRAGRGGRLAPEFERLGVITIGWASIPGLGDLRRHDDADVLRLLRDAGKVQRERSLRKLRWFHVEMAEGDIVVTPDSKAGDLVVGVITGTYDYADQPITGDHRHVRRVRWLGRRPRGLADPEHVTKNRALRTVALLPDQEHWLALAREVAAGHDTAGPSQPGDDSEER